MKRTPLRRGLKIALPAAAAVLVAASIGWAAIPGGNGVISGCYANKGGALRVIDAEQGKTCKATETPVVWNQNGPQGPPGPEGPPGAQSIADVEAFSGWAGTIPGDTGGWAFVGPTTEITTAPGQRIVASAQAASPPAHDA